MAYTKQLDIFTNVVENLKICIKIAAVMLFLCVIRL